MSCHACAQSRPLCCLAGRVPVTSADVERLAGRAVVTGGQGLPAAYAGEIPRRADGACAELQADDSCAIYDVRPEACRAQAAAACARWPAAVARG